MHGLLTESMRWLRSIIMPWSCATDGFKTYTSSAQSQPIVGTHSRKFWRKLLSWIPLEHFCLSGSVKLGGQPVLMRCVAWNRTTKVSVWSSSTLAVTNSRQVIYGVRLLLSWKYSKSLKRHLWPSSETQYWFVWTRPASFSEYINGALSGRRIFGDDEVMLSAFLVVQREHFGNYYKKTETCAWW